jgi:hypothetical protein
VNIEQPTKFLKDIAVIIGIVIGGWFALEAIFATREMVAENQVREVEREIDTGEKVRDYYQNMEDDGKDLNKFEARRHRINNSKLDRLYDELENEEDLLMDIKK